MRRAEEADLERLHALMSIREVYYYLADDTEPTLALMQGWIEQSRRDFAACGVGLWLLELGEPELAGCVLLEADPPRGCAELTYALHPAHRGEGLATRMSWTAIQAAFQAGHITEILASADVPNEASVAVMKRLGMSFHRSVTFPLHAGVEYAYRVGDRPPSPLPDLIAMR